MDQGDLRVARSLYERALLINEKVIGPEHAGTATTLYSLAEVLTAQGDLAAARSLYERALLIYEKTLGPEHPHTATTLHGLAGLLRRQGDLGGARRLYERVLAILGKVVGSEHPNTNRTRRSLAGVLLATGAPTMTRFLDGTTPGPTTAPASLPTRSTRLAAQGRRRRYGNGMGSRVLTNPSPHEPLAAAFEGPLSKMPCAALRRHGSRCRRSGGGALAVWAACSVEKIPGCCIRPASH